MTSNDNAIVSVVNGNIDNTNLAAGAALANLGAGTVTDAKLASPNNSVYKTVLASGSFISDGVIAATYVLVGPQQAFNAGTLSSNNAPLTSGGTIWKGGVSGLNTPGAGIVYFASADFTVGSLTQKLRVRAQVNCNATSWSSVTGTFGLYPVTFGAGAANRVDLTIGTVVSGSTVAIANPTNAANPNQGNSGDFTIPSDGMYALGLATSATLTTNAAALLTAQLQTRNV